MEVFILAFSNSNQPRRKIMKRKHSDKKNDENEISDFSKSNHKTEINTLRYCYEYMSKAEFEHTGIVETEKALEVCEFISFFKYFIIIG